MENKKTNFNIFGRVPSVPFNIKTLELFSLRLLLHHVSGAVDFENLRTINGNVFPTFQAACIKLGLLEDEAELDKIIEEAFLHQFGNQLRSLFCSILLYSTPSNTFQFWQNHKEKLAEDFAKENEKDVAINMVLVWLEERLALAEVTLKSLHLPEPDQNLSESEDREEDDNDSIALEDVPKKSQFKKIHGPESTVKCNGVIRHRNEISNVYKF